MVLADAGLNEKWPYYARLTSNLLLLISALAPNLLRIHSPTKDGK